MNLAIFSCSYVPITRPYVAFLFRTSLLENAHLSNEPNFPENRWKSGAILEETFSRKLCFSHSLHKFCNKNYLTGKQRVSINEKVLVKQNLVLNIGKKPCKMDVLLPKMTKAVLANFVFWSI